MPLLKFSVVIVVLSAVVGAGCSRAAAGEQKAPAAPPPPREVEVQTLAPSEVRDTGEYLGVLLSRESVNVLPQVNGYVRQIHVRPGQKVKAGQELISIDAREETAALDTAVAQAGTAEARVGLARQTLDRVRSLHDRGAVSTQELERAEAEVKSATAALEAAQATVSQRRVQVQFHSVRAAIPGVIGEVPVRVGDSVNPATKLTSIAQMDVLEVSTAVPAERARAIPPAAPLELLDGAGNVLVRSTVYYVAPEAQPQTQLVDVKAVFQNTLGLRPSELVRTRVVYGTRDALQVPPTAVTRQSGQPFVLAVAQKEGKTVVERRPVTLGPLTERAYVVEKGLKPGDRIAVGSIQTLRDGTAIIPVERKVPSQDPGVAPPVTR